jgi:hypothetical protein
LAVGDRHIDIIITILIILAGSWSGHHLAIAAPEGGRFEIPFVSPGPCGGWQAGRSNKMLERTQIPSERTYCGQQVESLTAREEEEDYEI